MPLAAAPSAEPCDGTNDVSLLLLPGNGGQFMLRSERIQGCLFSNRDGRFGWYACTPAYGDQHWSWLASPGQGAAGSMLRASHSGQCLFSNADGRFGLYACTAGYSDQRWNLAGPSRRRPVQAVAVPEVVGDWEWMDGTATAFHPDGSFVMPNDGGGTWRAHGPGAFEVRWGSGRLDRVRISPDGLTLRRDHSMGEGAACLSASSGPAGAPEVATTAAAMAAGANAANLSTADASAADVGLQADASLRDCLSLWNCPRCQRVFPVRVRVLSGVPGVPDVACGPAESSRSAAAHCLRLALKAAVVTRRTKNMYDRLFVP